LSDRGGDQVADDLGIKVIDLEVQLREGGFDEGFEVGFGDEEVEEDVLRALGVLEDGVDGGDGAAEVLHVEGDGHVDEGGVADGGGNGGGAFTVGGIAEWSGGAEGEARRREAEEAVEMVGGADGFGGVEGLEGGGEENDEHCGGEEARESHQPQHFDAAETKAEPGLLLLAFPVAVEIEIDGRERGKGCLYVSQSENENGNRCLSQLERGRWCRGDEAREEREDDGEESMLRCAPPPLLFFLSSLTTHSHSLRGAFFFPA